MSLPSLYLIKCLEQIQCCLVSVCNIFIFISHVNGLVTILSFQYKATKINGFSVYLYSLLKAWIKFWCKANFPQSSWDQEIRNNNADSQPFLRQLDNLQRFVNLHAWMHTDIYSGSLCSWQQLPLTCSGALMTPVLYPNCREPMTAVARENSR